MISEENNARGKLAEAEAQQSSPTESREIADARLRIDDSRTSDADAPSEVKRSAQLVTGGSIAEAIGGAAAVLLAILGLAEVLTFWVTALATICLGAALLLRAAAIAARFKKLLAETTPGESGSADLGAGMGVEFMGGAAGVILAVLAMANIVPWVLLPVAVIVYGATLLVSSGATARLNTLAIGRYPVGELRSTASEIVMAAAGTQVLIGLTAIVLGVLALAGVTTVALTQVGLLCVGASVLLSGAAVSSRMVAALRT